MEKPSLVDLLGPSGALSKALPLYEPRKSQLEMATRVEDALAHGRALVVEAGTGTGKTLAYLLPAARSGLKVVISTATKTLQEQLAEKDVPLLKQLGVTAQFAFLKGRQNYLCLLRHDQFDRNPTFAVREEGALYEQIAEWAKTTQTGDKAELESLPEGFATWKDLTSTADSCTGQKCSYFDQCFVFKMRRKAAEADVVVVNHHLFFADLALRSSSAGDTGAAVIPRYDAVIFDEAHAVEEVATEHFGAQLSSYKVSELGRDAIKVLQQKPKLVGARDLAARLLREGGEFFAAAAALRPEGRPMGARPDSSRGQSGRSGKPPERSFSRAQPASDEGRWALHKGDLAPAEDERLALVEMVRALGASLSGEDDDSDLALLERRCVALGAEIALFGDHALAAPGTKEGALIHWAEVQKGHLFLHASPVEIGSILQDRLYDRIGPVVFTSATLAVASGLDYFQQRVGLADETGPLFPTDAAVLASPFDYEKNAALYLPPRGTLPEPSDPGFPEAVAGELRHLLPITGGRAFALFTSLRNMRRVHELLKDELPYQVLLQGEAPKAQLLRKFRERPSVLFASQSFWEGVDVQGDALSLVVIDKLPFASPSDPIVAARMEQLGDGAFYGYQVPQAALALKQGFGRLIRSAQDRGVVAVLDPRMTAKSYGRVFVQSLPRCRLVRTAGEVREFWDNP